MYSASFGGKPLIPFYGNQYRVLLGITATSPSMWFLEDSFFFVLKLAHAYIHVSCIFLILCRFSKITTSSPLPTLTASF